MKEKKNSTRPPFNKKLAASYIGKYILVGLTYLDHEDHEIRKQQLHGEIISATPNGIKISLRGIYEGKSWNMPPDLESIHPAQPGQYKLQMTQEVIENPDLLATWTIHEPHPKADQSKT